MSFTRGGYAVSGAPRFQRVRFQRIRFRRAQISPRSPQMAHGSRTVAAQDSIGRVSRVNRLRLLTPPRIALAAILIVALVIRWQFVDFQSGDYRAFLDRWYAYLAENGGFAALQDGSFSNYNTPYLALLAGTTYLPVPEIVAIKAISVIFDVTLAGFAYHIIRALRPTARWLPTLAFGAVIMLPTVIMNGSQWAQCDAIYVTFCLGSVYFLIKRRPWLAAAFFGIAFAFKLQAIFFLPVLVVVMIVNRHRLRALLAAPLAFLICLTPALIAGRSLLSQLSVYPSQIANPSGGGGGPGGRGGFSATATSSFTNNAPTPYAWLSGDASTSWKYAGLALAAVVALAFGIWLLARRRQLTGADIVLVAATATLVVPLLLPEMHERYFYLAEVLCVLAAFVDRRFIVVAAAIQVASISTYLSYLDNAPLMPLRLAAMVAFAGAVLAAVSVVRRLSVVTGTIDPCSLAGSPRPGTRSSRPDHAMPSVT